MPWEQQTATQFGSVSLVTTSKKKETAEAVQTESRQVSQDAMFSRGNCSRNFINVSRCHHDE